MRHRDPGRRRDGGPRLRHAPPACSIKENGTLEVDRYTLETSRRRFYAGGDLITGASNVSNAMGYGKKAARNIDERLMGAERWDRICSRSSSTTRRLPKQPSESRRHHGHDAAGARSACDSFDEVVLGPVARKRPWRKRCRCLRCDVEGSGIALEGGATPCRRRKFRSASTASWSTPREGQTILEVARASGKYIPTLCYLEGLSAVGACRLCMVEVSGRRPPAARLHHAGAGRHVGHHQFPRSWRGTAASPSNCCWSERNHVCAVCVSNGHCELQAMAQRLGVTSVRYPYNFPRLAVDLSHPRYVLDHNRCILCTRCVRVCAEVEGAHVWDDRLARHPRPHRVAT